MMAPGSTSPRSAGVSPPPQTAPAARQPSANPFDELLRPVLVGEPVRVSHRGVHRHRDRQRAAGDQVVGDRGHRVDADLAVMAPPALGLDRVGHEVLGPQALLDVREEMVLGLDQVGAFAPHGRPAPR